jgi:hypothetical protein
LPENVFWWNSPEYISYCDDLEYQEQV